MELKKNFLVIICILVSISGLLIIYFFSKNIIPSEFKISQIDSSLEGKIVSVTGKITYVRKHQSGHIFLTISDETSSIEIPIFSNFLNQLSTNGITSENFKKGKVVKITGVVGKYKDRLQIVPRKISDIIFLA